MASGSGGRFEFSLARTDGLSIDSLLLHPLTLAQRLCTSFADDHSMKEFEELCDLTGKAVDICVSELKTVINEVVQTKTREGFAPFTAEKHDLFGGAARLAAHGFFNKDPEKSKELGLKALVTMHSDVAALLKASTDEIKSLPLPDKFSFWQQMQSSQWIKVDLKKMFGDDAWCDQANSDLGNLLSTLVGDQDMKNELTRTVGNQVKNLRGLFDEVITKDLKTVDKLDEVAKQFVLKIPDEKWLTQDDAMEL